MSALAGAGARTLPGMAAALDGIGRTGTDRTAAAAPGLTVRDALLSISGRDGLGADLPAVSPTTPRRSAEANHQAALIPLQRVGAAVEAAAPESGAPGDRRDPATPSRTRKTG